ncbi:MAG: glycosyltransferase family 4 protein [Bacteroidetes bacterium]|nr:glycosyltransferase family 4 protein [Bacteroidota bacterium]
MKVGFDGKRAFFNYTGLGNYSRLLIRSLSFYNSEDQFNVYTPDLMRNAETEFLLGSENISVRLPKTAIGRKFQGIWRATLLSRHLEEDELNIYHGLSNELPYPVHKSDIKAVVTIHDLIFLRYPKLYPAIDLKVYKFKSHYACKAADKIVAVSQQTKEDIINFYSYPEEKIRVIYQACDPKYYEPESENRKAEVAKRYGLPSNYILNVGTIEKRKNLLTLVKAVDLLADNNDVFLVVVGRPTEYKKIVMHYIAEHKLEKNVLMLDDVAAADLPAVYQQADLFVYPSRFEGFGIPIIEALYSKLPVITSKGSCFYEAAGSSSIFVDPDNAEELADAMYKILTDSDLKEQMIELGFDHVQQFNQESTARKMMELYRELLGN